MTEVQNHKLAIGVLQRRCEQLEAQIKFRNQDMDQMRERLQAAHEQVISAHDELGSITALLVSLGVEP